MNTLRNIIVIVAALLASPSLVHAQEGTAGMSVRVPFPFTVQGIAMPAGRYDVTYIGSDRLWRLRTFGHYDLELQVTGQELPKPALVSSLIFEHSAAGYTLRQIRQSGERDALEIARPGAGKKSILHEASTDAVANRTVAQSVAHSSVAHTTATAQ